VFGVFDKHHRPMPEFRFIAAFNDLRSRRMAVSHVVRAKKAGVPYERIDVGRLYHEKRGICGWCGERVPFDVFTVDHIRPLSKGGPHLIWNLQVAHAGCNASKGRSLRPGFSE
jgi:5-methylcytosine-specific restriction endonuclease McrA